DLALLVVGALAYSAGLAFLLVRIAIAAGTKEEGALCFARLVREREGWSYGIGGILCLDGEGLSFLRRGRRIGLWRAASPTRIAEIQGARAAFVLGRVELRPYLRFETDQGQLTIDAIVPAELSRRLGAPRP
ncbi:MAG TPA: hypothetical protein VFL04_08835, partial [Rectinemataceae bacterium]|nr:hypothetical protein [Rectinemataceae bacterium]